MLRLWKIILFLLDDLLSREPEFLLRRYWSADQDIHTLFFLCAFEMLLISYENLFL